ncbi:MAG: hypothetical protein IH984_16945 [Planctomycetes bacterium]|nr:hypothetical protein [Planctomycetota bacterium]
MKHPRKKMGFTLTELLVVVLVILLGISLVVPAMAKSKGDSMLQESMSNLMTLSVAHVLFAADNEGRQVSYTVDDLSVYGSVQGYNDAHGCGGGDPWNPGCIPPIIAGWGESFNGSVGVFAYWSHMGFHSWAFLPIGFPDGQGIDGFGNFRIGNAKRLHDYVNGRFYDPTFYAPKDTVAMAEIEPAFDDPFEFPTAFNPPTWISYVNSPASMYHPDVMRSNAAGGWQDPWSIANGFESPGLFQATYPDLKTQIIEHNWLQNPPADCNPAGSCIGLPGDCTPYQFNHSINSAPASLFYDGHIRLLPNTEVLAADLQVLKDTGGVDGLWHRGTSFGSDGYCISYGYDGVPLSHHILTTDGIMGRDTLGGMSPLAGKSKHFDRSGWRKSIKPPSTDDDIDKPKTNWSIELLPD